MVEPFQIAKIMWEILLRHLSSRTKLNFPLLGSGGGAPCTLVYSHCELLMVTLSLALSYNLFKCTDRGASTFYLKNFCPCPRSCPRVIWFVPMITLESLNQSEPNFHT